MTLKISLILAHPNPASFNHAIARAALQTLQHHGHQVYWHDLYAEGFDPLLPGEELDREAVYRNSCKATAGRSPRPTAWSLSIPTGGASPRPS